MTESKYANTLRKIGFEPYPHPWNDLVTPLRPTYVYASSMTFVVDEKGKSWWKGEKVPAETLKENGILEYKSKRRAS